jgi:predicted DNA-binding protein
MDKHAQASHVDALHEGGSTTAGKAAIRKSRPKSSRIVSEQPVSVRFDPEMIERLDRVASQLSKVNVNIRIGRSSVVKLALERALLALEAELAIVKPDTFAQFR